MNRALALVAHGGAGGAAVETAIVLAIAVLALAA